MTILTPEDRRELLPNSSFWNINFSYYFYDDKQGSVMEDYFKPDCPVVFEFEVSDLIYNDNYKTAYKVFAKDAF